MERRRLMPPDEPGAALTAASVDVPPATRAALDELLLALADDEFVIGFWDSEWTGIAPMLEEDVATSSVAQDEIGHAKALYELLAELRGTDADRIAYGRDVGAFRHARLLDHARGDWAFSCARRYLYETADAVRLDALSSGSWEPLALVAGKMRREETYHLLHADAWLRRLQEAPGEARDRLAEAIRVLWPDAHDVFAPLAGEEELVRAGILPTPMRALHASWERQVRPRLEGIAGRLPDAVPRLDGRADHTGDFAWLHGQFTMVSRSQPGATW
jgi:ring-1,2-phenylacetyl-CoA epoxidase subunit PaaC